MSLNSNSTPSTIWGKNYRPHPTLSSTICSVWNKILLAIVSCFSMFCASLSYCWKADLESFTLAVWKSLLVNMASLVCLTRTRDFVKTFSTFSFFPGSKKWGSFLPVFTTTWMALDSKPCRYMFFWTSYPIPTKTSKKTCPLYFSLCEVASSTGFWDQERFSACYASVAVLHFS